jgi:hypothetical protein
MVPAASTPFYEVISVISIQRWLLSESTSFALARKQVPATDLSRAKNQFFNIFLAFFPLLSI